MALGVQQPSSRRSKPVDPIDTSKNTLDHILTGLEMANAALGVAGNIDKLSQLNTSIPKDIKPIPGPPLNELPRSNMPGRFSPQQRLPRMTYQSPMYDFISRA